jgi:hypothetical protein
MKWVPNSRENAVAAMNLRKKFLNIVVTALTVLFLARVFRHKDNRSSISLGEARVEDTPVTWRRRKKLFGVNVAAVIFLIVAVVSGIAGWILFRSAESGDPSRPSFSTGGLLIFTDQPAERCTIYVNVQRSGRFEVSVSSPSGAGGNFLIVASGSASVQPVDDSEVDYYPIGSIPDFSSGEIQTVQGSFGPAKRKNNALEGKYFGYDIHNYVADGHVMMAVGQQFDGNYDENKKFLVLGDFRSSISSSSGSTEDGSLPYIGVAQDMTSSISGGVSDEPVGPITVSRTLSKAALEYGDSVTSNTQKWYVPNAAVDISVAYPGSSDNAEIAAPGNSILPQNYQLDSATPPTASSGELFWRGSASATVSWSLTNTAAARNSSDRLFLSGLILGAAVSFLGMSLDRSLRED